MTKRGFSSTIGLLALFLGALAMAPFVVPIPFYLYLIQLSALYVLLSVSLNFVMGFAGQPSLGQAAFFGIGAYGSALLTLKLGVGFLPAFAGAAMMGGLLGIFVGAPSLRVREFYLAIATLGLALVFQTILNEWDAVTGGANGLAGIPPMTIGGVAIGPEGTYYFILGFTVLTGASHHGFRRSRWGRALQAVRSNETAAMAMGIQVYRKKLFAFALSGMLAAMAGSLYAHSFSFVSPDTFGVNLTILILVMMTVGGEATTWGPVVGALLVSLLSIFLSRFSEFHPYVYGTVLILTAALLPEGIMGHLERRRRRLGDRGAREHGIREDEDRIEMAASKTTPLALIPKADFLEREASVERFARMLVTGTSPVGRPQRKEESLLRVEGATKVFGGVRALWAVDLEVADGTIRGLIGPNGSGKTTLVNVISGLYKADMGRVFFDGEPFDAFSMSERSRRGIVRTFQTPILFPGMSVLENVMTGQHGWRKADLLRSLTPRLGGGREELATECLAREALVAFGLSHLEDREGGGLPFGLQRLVEIVRALLARPRLLILDEPAAGLHELEIEHLKAVILGLRDAGLTVILIEHHMDLVFEISDEITVLQGGMKLAEGIPSAVARDPEVIAAYLGRPRPLAERRWSQHVES